MTSTKSADRASQSEGNTSLELVIRHHLEDMLGSYLAPLVRNAIASDVAQTTAVWLEDLAHAEVFDSEGEGALRRAARQVSA